MPAQRARQREQFVAQNDKDEKARIKELNSITTAVKQKLNEA